MGLKPRELVSVLTSDTMGTLRANNEKLHLENERLHLENEKMRWLIREIWQSCPVSEEDCACCPHSFERSDRLEAENAELRELLREYHTFLALADLAQPIGYVITAKGNPTLSVKKLNEKYRELGVEVDDGAR